MNIRKVFSHFILLSFILIVACTNKIEREISQDNIVNGVAWFDQNNNEVNAHGNCIIKEGDLYYMFGEYKGDSSNAFIGFSCYSSADLVHWKFENMALPRQTDGFLGPERVGERPKVMKCPSTGEYVMYMHTDDMKYMDPHVGFATCQTINGDYQFHGELLYDGKYIHKWDLGTFQDDDGKGYLLTHEGCIYELADDYKSVVRMVAADEARGGESPAMFKKDGVYFWLFSSKTSWERNDNYYLASNSLEGPWDRRGHLAPEGSLTWNSQTTFVLPVHNGSDTVFIYMGDRWSYPMQGSAASYVWLPITISDGNISIPQYHQTWKLDCNKGLWSSKGLNFNYLTEKEIETSGNWIKDGAILKSKEKGAALSCTFNGKQLIIYGTSNSISGYGKLTLSNEKGEEVLSTYIDFYSKYENTAIKFMSPLLNYGKYILNFEVIGTHPVWMDKAKNVYGSTDDFVTITKIGVI